MISAQARAAECAPTALSRSVGSLDNCRGLSQNNRVNAEKFESLSDEALYALADRIGLDLPPDLERVFVLEEILGALEEDSEERRASGRAPVRMEETKFSGSELDGVESRMGSVSAVQLTYNETAIHLLVRDPSWAFAFWDISDNDRQILRTEDGPPSLFLRVFEIDKSDTSDNKRDFFDIPLSEEDAQWYINLPRPKSRYRIELCARLSGKVKVLARSKEVLVPRQLLDEGSSALAPDTAELLRLSGLEVLDIEPPNDDNPQRILKTGSAGE
jgi:hypothetical protein